MHATLTELNLAHEYWEIPGIKHDLPRLSAWWDRMDCSLPCGTLGSAQSASSLSRRTLPRRPVAVRGSRAG